MKHLILIGGPPASGKTRRLANTIRELWRAGHEPHAITFDEMLGLAIYDDLPIYRTLTGAVRDWTSSPIPPAQLDAAASQLHAATAITLARPDTTHLLIEAPFLTPASRVPFITLARQLNARLQCHWERTSEKTAQTRNQHRITQIPLTVLEKQHATCADPTKEEIYGHTI